MSPSSMVPAVTNGTVPRDNWVIMPRLPFDHEAPPPSPGRSGRQGHAFPQCVERESKGGYVWMGGLAPTVSVGLRVSVVSVTISTSTQWRRLQEPSWAGDRTMPMFSSICALGTVWPLKRIISDQSPGPCTSGWP